MAVQAALVESGAVAAVAQALKLSNGPAVKAVLLALVHILDKQPAAQAQFMATPGAVESLARMLGVKGEEVLARAALVSVSITSSPAAQPAAESAAACNVDVVPMLASSPQPTWLHVGQGQGKSTASPGSDAAVTWDAGAGSQTYSIQCKLAEAGFIPLLVRLLGHQSPEVRDKAVMALCGLLRGNRPNQVLTAAAGGIPALVNLIDTPPPPSNPMLARRAVDAWLELGGAPALVKLLTHKRPGVCELAAHRMVGLLAPGGVTPQATAAGVTAGGVGTAAVAPADTADVLLKAGVAAALLKSAKSRHASVAEAALMATTALLAAGKGKAQGALVDAGAMTTLQSLMALPAAVMSAASGAGYSEGAGAGGTGQRPGVAQPANSRGRARGGGRPGASRACRNSAASDIARPASAGKSRGQARGNGATGAAAAGAAAATPIMSPSVTVTRLAAQVSAQLFHRL